MAKSCITVCFTYSLRMARFFEQRYFTSSDTFRVWWGICTWVCYTFPVESNGEKFLKIGQYLVKLWPRVWCLVFDSRWYIHTGRHEDYSAWPTNVLIAYRALIAHKNTVGGEIWCSVLSTHAFLLGNGQTYATLSIVIVPYYRVSRIFMSRIFSVPVRDSPSQKCRSVALIERRSGMINESP